MTRSDGARQSEARQGTLRFVVRGNPKPAPRPRARAFQTKSGHHVAQVYAGSTDKDWRALVAAAAREAWGEEPVMDGAVVLGLSFHLLRPKSVSVNKRPDPTTKPDLDNLVKSVKDAMNGLVWRDDSQVIRIEAEKVYTDAHPGVAVEARFA